MREVAVGLFSFAKSIGKKLGIGRDEEEARIQAMRDEVEKQAAAAALDEKMSHALTAALVGLGIGLEAPRVMVARGHATITGTAHSQADKEKAVLTVGNFEGVEAVDDRLVVEAPEPPAYFHTVKRGDTLSLIAKEYYGLIFAYDVIFGANYPMIRDADEIFPGQVLRIPPIEGVPYTVQPGDTLGTIAKKWYGDAGRYRLIAAHNRLANPDAIDVNQALVLPVTKPLPAA